MTHRGLYLKNSFISSNAPINNGIGRFIPQLARITIKFCKSDGSSYGVRRFIEEEIVQFAKKNPATVVYLKPRRHRSPVVVAEYLNGEKFHQSLHNYPCDEVSGYMEMYRGQSGVEYSAQDKYSYSDHPSIQGYWSPTTHKDPNDNLMKYPGDLTSNNDEVTATQMIQQMFSQQKSDSTFSQGEENKLESRKQGEK